MGIINKESSLLKEQKLKLKEIKNTNKNTQQTLKFLKICQIISSKEEISKLLQKLVTPYLKHLSFVYSYIEKRLGV